MTAAGGRGRPRPIVVLAAPALAAVACGLAALAWVATAMLRVYRTGRRSARPVVGTDDSFRADVPPDPEAIVVFGTTATAAGPSRVLRARLDQAARLWRAGVAPVLVVTGGVADGVDEVDVMRDWLVADGIPPDAVLPARPGHNTRASVRAIDGMGYRRVVAVSTPFHAARIEAEGRRRGIAIATSSPPSIPPSLRLRISRAAFISESAGLMWYELPPAVASRVYTGPGSFRHLVPRVLAGEVRALDAIRSRLRARLP